MLVALLQQRTNNLCNVIQNKHSPMKCFKLTLELLLILTVAQATIFLRRRDPRQFAVIDAHAIVDIVIVLTISLLLIVNMQRLSKTLKWISKSPALPITLYYFFCAVSTLWSPMPSYTGFRAIQYLSLFWAVLVIFSYYDADHFCEAEKRFLLLAVLAVILNFGLHVKLYGLFMSLKELHTNSYTASAAMLFCYVLGESLGKRTNKNACLLPIGLFAIFFVIIGTCTASYFAIIVGIATAFLLSRRPLIAFYTLLILIIGGVIFSSDQSMDLLYYGKSEGSRRTWTGRLTLWTDYWRLFKQSPLWGHGFSIINRIGSKYTATNAHNAVFAVLLGTGLFGFAVMIWGTIRLIRQTVRGVIHSLDGAIGCASAFATGLVNAMAVAFIGDLWLSPSFVFTMLLALQVVVLSQDAVMPEKSRRAFR